MDSFITFVDFVTTNPNISFLSNIFLIYFFLALLIHRKDRKELEKLAISHRVNVSFEYSFKGLKFKIGPPLFVLPVLFVKKESIFFEDELLGIDEMLLILGGLQEDDRSTQDRLQEDKNEEDDRPTYDLILIKGKIFLYRKEDGGKSMKVRFLTDSGSTSNPI